MDQLASWKFRSKRLTCALTRAAASGGKEGRDVLSDARWRSDANSSYAQASIRKRKRMGIDRGKRTCCDVFKTFSKYTEEKPENVEIAMTAAILDKIRVRWMNSIANTRNRTMVKLNGNKPIKTSNERSVTLHGAEPMHSRVKSCVSVNENSPLHVYHERHTPISEFSFPSSFFDGPWMIIAPKTRSTNAFHWPKLNFFFKTMTENTPVVKIFSCIITL